MTGEEAETRAYCRATALAIDTEVRRKPKSVNIH